ncbi:MAG: hypothetical protein RL021_347 [Bacteroidota bacterium]|jgi:molybdopterin converting factor small subunit
MELRIRTFGKLAEHAGGELLIPAVPDTRMLKAALEALHPVFRDVPFRIAVNRRLVDGDVPLSPSDEIAVLPPFSGG